MRSYQCNPSWEKKKKLKPGHTCYVFAFCWECVSNLIFFIKFIAMNEWDGISQADQRVQNWEYSFI